MTGLARGPGAPILRGYLQNFVFMITLLLLLLLLLSPLSARRLINRKLSARGFAIVICLLLLLFCLFVCLFCLFVRLLACFACLLACLLVCLFACIQGTGVI